jgi:integrase
MNSIKAHGIYKRIRKFIGKFDWQFHGIRPFFKARHKCGGNISFCMRKTGYENIDRIELTVQQFVGHNSVSPHSITGSHFLI